MFIYVPSLSFSYWIHSLGNIFQFDFCINILNNILLSSIEHLCTIRNPYLLNHMNACFEVEVETGEKSVGARARNKQVRLFYLSDVLHTRLYETHNMVLEFLHQISSRLVHTVQMALYSLVNIRNTCKIVCYQTGLILTPSL